MSSLTRSGARPRNTLRIPCYPAAVVASAAALSACAASSSQPAASAATAPEPQAVVAVSAVPESRPDPALIADNPPAPSPDAPWRLNPGTYPSDNAQIAIGCGGGCPPAWQLEADHRDHGMITARVQHCYELVGGGKRGRIQVTVDIDAQGHARSVKAKHTGAIPDLVDQCAEELLGKVQFQATNNYVRSPGIDEEYPKAVTVTLPKRGQ